MNEAPRTAIPPDDTCAWCPEPAVKTDGDGTPLCAGCARGLPKPFRHAGPRPGRNAPCPCGSGRKYKRCCLGGTITP